MLKQIHQFITENAGRLSSQLSAFESNVATETADIRATFLPNLTPLNFTSSSATAATLLPGQIGLCDSNLGNLTVTLSAPASLKPGWLAIVKRFAANNVTLVPSGLTKISTARRINATTSKVYAAVGVFWVYFDGADWWA
jgi:hypothetical protein